MKRFYKSQVNILYSHIYEDVSLIHTRVRVRTSSHTSEDTITNVVKTAVTMSREGDARSPDHYYSIRIQQLKNGEWGFAQEDVATLYKQQLLPFHSQQ